MDIDYPSSHSMDTRWFAVDADGHVGIFWSGENGAVPDQATPEDIYELLQRLDATGRSLDDFYPLDTKSEVCRLGFFTFDFKEDYGPVVELYQATTRPSHPIHVDQLPPPDRTRAKRIRFRRLRFEETEWLQIIEHMPCRFWSSGEVAYLASDGRTIRSIPGQEDRFADFCKEFRTQYPEHAERLQFQSESEG